MNTELRKKEKLIFKKDFIKLMNNPVFVEIIENIIKHQAYQNWSKKELFGI